MLGWHFRRGWEKAFRFFDFEFVASAPEKIELENHLREPFDLIMTASGGEGIRLLPIDQLNEYGTALIVNGLPFNKLRISPEIQAPLADKAEVILISKFNKKLIWSQWEPDFVEPFFAGYMELGIPVIPLPYAGDTLGWCEIVDRDIDLEFDIAFVGNLKHRLRGNISLIKKLLNTSTRSKIKLVGGEDWEHYLGIYAEPMIEGQDPSDFYRRAIVAPNIHTKRQREHGLQLNDRVFQIPASGGFQICDNPLVRRYFKANELLMANNENDFLEMTNYFLRNPEKRIAYINAGMQAVVAKHSYVNRVHKILNELQIRIPGSEVGSEVVAKRQPNIGVLQKSNYFIESRVMNVASITRRLRKNWIS